MADFKEKWINQACQKIKLLFPKDDEDSIREFLSEAFDRDYVDNKCTIYNNYEKEEVETSYYNLFNWIDERKPILTESGSLFKQHDECYNPNTTILAKKLAERKIEKKKKFKYMDMANHEKDPVKKEELKYKAKKADLAQLRLKIIANSEYGVSGLPSSWFFNMACASATTARGQALISTAFNSFEDFLADNVLFMNMDECLMFINNIVNEKPIREKNDEKWVNNKSKRDVFNRILNKFEDPSACDTEVLEMIVNNLSQEDRNRIYYKSNMYEFFRNSKKASELLKEIIFDTNSFLNPAEPPETIKKPLDKLRSAVLEYVHYNYPTPDRVIRLKTRPRKVVIVIDTDSNFINLGPWIEFIYNEILGKYVKISKREKENGKYVIRSREGTKGKTDKAKQQEEFRMINTMVNITTYMIERVLNLFCERSNIKPDHPGTLNMKNEFLYDTILVTPAKKHYQSAIRIQEGVYFEQPELDVKGKLTCPVA